MYADASLRPNVGHDKLIRFNKEARVDLLDSIQATMDSLEKELIEKLKSRVPAAFEIGSHILHSGGKRIRPQLAIISARLGGYTGFNAIKLSQAIEWIHTATLLHDDVVDHADTRRGIPSANSLWSNEMCVLGGDYILAKAFSMLTSINDMRLVKLVSETTERLSEGELFQMMNIGNVDFSEESYIQVISDKTAVLMEAACRGGAMLGGLGTDAEEALGRFGFNLGLAFQMTDDVIDYRSSKAEMGKMPGKDLEEGKLTLPLIIALKKATPQEKQQIKDVITAGVVGDQEFALVKQLLATRGGIEETLDRSRRYLEESKQYLEMFPDSEEKRALLTVTDRILNRTY